MNVCVKILVCVWGHMPVYTCERQKLTLAFIPYMLSTLVFKTESVPGLHLSKRGRFAD